jgi:cobalt-zinc-cadmium efflux system outer membrane protein
MRDLSVLLLFLSLFSIQARGQALPVPAPASTPMPEVDIPRQLSLQKAEEILLQKNLALTAARYGVDVARAQRLIAGLRPNPTITFGAEQFDFTGSDFSRAFHDLVTTNPNSAANRTYTFRYDYILERGNKRELRTAVAESQLQAAEAQLLDATRQQLFQLKQSFYTAVLARENLRVADENIYLINSTEQLIKLHVDTGDTAEWELIKFQSNKVQYQRDLFTAQLSYQQSVRDVLNLLGAQPSNVVAMVPISQTNPGPSLLADAPVEVVGDLGLKPVDLSLAEFRQAAFDRRPDAVSARHNVEAAEHALELANALRHRDVDVAGEYQRLGSENTFGVTVSVPLFLHNNHRSEISQAVAQLAQAKAQLAQVQLQVLTDVDKAYKAYESSRRMVQLYTRETVSKAEESFRIAGVSYKEGATSLLELSDAQRTYNQTRVAYNQAHLDYRMSLFQLELATGKKITD